MKFGMKIIVSIVGMVLISSSFIVAACFGRERLVTEKWYIQDPTVAKQESEWKTGIAPEIWFTWWESVTHEYRTYKEEYSNIKAYLGGVNLHFSKGKDTVFAGLRLGEYTADLVYDYGSLGRYDLDFNAGRFELDLRLRHLYPGAFGLTRAVPYLIGGLFYTIDVQISRFLTGPAADSEYEDVFSAITPGLGVGLLYPFSDHSGMRIDVGMGPSFLNRECVTYDNYRYSETDTGFVLQNHCTFYHLFSENFNAQFGYKFQYLDAEWGILPIFGGFVMLGYSF